MKHTRRRCPHCNHSIQIVLSTWNTFKIFHCSFCGSTVKKVAKRWGGIMGHTLECV